jgi:hypothetical protein
VKRFFAQITEDLVVLFSPEMESGLVVRPMKSYPLIGAAFFCIHTLFKTFRFILQRIHL